MKNKKLLYILAISIGFSSNNALSMGGWLSEKFSGFTTQAQTVLGSMLNNMQEWSTQKTVAVASAAIIALVTAIGPKRVYGWFDRLMHKIESEAIQSLRQVEDLSSLKQTDQSMQQTKYEPTHPIGIYLKNKQYHPETIHRLRLQYTDPNIVSVINEELIRHYSDNISNALATIPEKDRPEWISKGKQILTLDKEAIEAKREGPALTSTIDGTELGSKGTKHKALEQVESQVATIPYLGGTVKKPEMVLLNEN